jgi:hypothetical protein
VEKDRLLAFSDGVIAIIITTMGSRSKLTLAPVHL